MEPTPPEPPPPTTTKAKKGIKRVIGGTLFALMFLANILNRSDPAIAYDNRAEEGGAALAVIVFAILAVVLLTSGFAAMRQDTRS